MTAGILPIQRAFNLIRRLQDIDEHWELRSAALFLLIAWKREVSKPDAEALLSLPPGTSHRKIEELQDECLVRVAKVAGVNVMRLTEYGEEFAGALVGLMGPAR